MMLHFAIFVGLLTGDSSFSPGKYSFVVDYATVTLILMPDGTFAWRFQGCISRREHKGKWRTDNNILYTINEHLQQEKYLLGNNAIYPLICSDTPVVNIPGQINAYEYPDSYAKFKCKERYQCGAGHIFIYDPKWTLKSVTELKRYSYRWYE